ncbi:hypothetical protein B296_00008446 [Ensete ventricosum]|uniref:Uncharacterized protein n=1 Tax=Ensete ventricosum TaxID=4639 RepID=A0A426Z871_ENSVE|nr:hypothetical protein B296_00008446 [Ensete ventricosum]
MGRYRSRSRSFSPRRYSRSPPSCKYYDDPSDRGGGGGGGGRDYRDRRSSAPSGLLIRNIALNARSIAPPQVRGIANSKDSVLIQGLVHGRRSVRGHPKAQSELGAMEHQNFLFGMEMICPYAAKYATSSARC